MAIRGEREYDTEFRVVWPDRSIHYIRALAKVQRDADGQPIRMIGTNWDVTAQKHSEADLRQALSDRNALLMEVHHRVKNNLQVITSLLRLEAGRNADAPTKVVLADMQGRIRSMALLHESIYRAGTYAAIDLAAYVGEITTQAFRSLQTGPGAVRLRLDLGSVRAGLDQATPCGLLLTELVSNTLKHGFPEGRRGEVCVSLRPIVGAPPTPGNSGDQWCLRVSDNGVGLPADFAARQQESLGLQLVQSLTDQLGGSLAVGLGLDAGGTSGASFAVTFSVTKLAPLVMAV